MDSYLLIIIAVSVIMTAIGVFQNKKMLLIFLVTTSVLMGWYIQVLRVEFYNDLAWQEFAKGARTIGPSDGASNSLVLMFGWIPSLALSLLIIGAQKLKRKYELQNT